MEDKKKQQLNVEIPSDKAEGTYSNLVMITHSPAEFILDFTKMMPGVPKAIVQSRIIMTPHHAKMFLHALQENIKMFENQFGEIKVPGKMNNKQFGFSGPTN
ncbi:MAG: DUF3467 domain-containing protein [Calditrichia bacterium]